MMKVMTKSKGIEFKLSITRPIGVCLYGDDLRLRQILLNILSNAVKFTTKGYVLLAVDLAEDNLVFRITDTGMGIKKEELALIFEPFSQADIHKNRKLQGTGLGLPICKNLIELMNGSIEVASAYGKGSTFTITLPRIAGDETQLERENVEAANIYAPEASILVVDDIDINLYVAEAMLEEFGIRAVTTTSGSEAIKLVQEMDFDIVFMDHMMPEMDGIEATQLIRDLGDKYKALPIIALTANAVTEARQLFDEAGMDDFISKPIEVDRLGAILEKWIPANKILRKKPEHSLS